ERLEVREQFVGQMRPGPVERDAAGPFLPQLEAGGVRLDAARIAAKQFGESGIAVQSQVAPGCLSRFVHQIPLSYNRATRLGRRAMIANPKFRRIPARPDSATGVRGAFSQDPVDSVNTPRPVRRLDPASAG